MHERLISNQDTPTRCRTTPLAIAIPLYIYPALDAWTTLFDIIQKFPGIEFHLIINPANGPGGTIPDSNYISQVDRLNSFPNALVFGYVHVSWAKRELSHVLSDIDVWSQWANTKDHDMHVDGIFVDEAPSDLDELQYMARIYQHVKQKLQDGGVWTNPGVAIDQAFYDVADLVNSHENTYVGWLSLQQEVMVKLKSTTMIHSFSGSPAELKSLTDLVSRLGYRSALITTSNCYTSFSDLLRPFAEAVSHLQD